MTPQEIAESLGGCIDNNNFGMFDHLPSAQEFKYKMEDAGYQAGEPIRLQEKYIVPFINGDIESACPVCGGEVYFNFDEKRWGHPLRCKVAYYRLFDEEKVASDSLYFIHMVEEFRNAYYKVPEGYTWQDVRDHIPCDFPEIPCEICARTTYGCPR